MSKENQNEIAAFRFCCDTALYKWFIDWDKGEISEKKDNELSNDIFYCMKSKAYEISHGLLNGISINFVKYQYHFLRCPFRDCFTLFAGLLKYKN